MWLGNDWGLWLRGKEKNGGSQQGKGGEHHVGLGNRSIRDSKFGAVLGERYRQSCRNSNPVVEPDPEKIMAPGTGPHFARRAA